MCHSTCHIISVPCHVFSRLSKVSVGNSYLILALVISRSQKEQDQFAAMKLVDIPTVVGYDVYAA